MPLLDACRKATEGMAAPALLRYLVLERFRSKCVVTSALRARSVVVLSMIADIDRATPVVFCHATTVFPESVEYAARIVDLLGLLDVRQHHDDETSVLPDDVDHSEEVRSKVWGGGTVPSLVHLNRSLAGFECWISAVYHRPYTAEPPPRLALEGRLLRVDPLNGWSQEEVHAYMADHDLPQHPLVTLTRPKSLADATVPYPTYHY